METRLHRWRMRARLRRLHGGELSPTKARALRAHLARCPYCAGELAWLEATDRLLTTARPTLEPLPPGEARALFHAALESSGVLRRRRRRALVWALPALGCAVLAAAGGSRLAASLVGTTVHVPVQVAVVTPPEHNFDFGRGEANTPVSALPAVIRDAEPPVVRRIARKRRHRAGRRMAVRRLHRVRRHHPQAEPAAELLARAEPPAVAKEPSHLLVLVTTPAEVPPQMGVTVRKMDADAPGFARASAFHPGPYGGGTMTEFIVASNSLKK